MFITRKRIIQFNITDLYFCIQRFLFDDSSNPELIHRTIYIQSPARKYYFELNQMESTTGNASNLIATDVREVENGMYVTQIIKSETVN